MNFDPEKMTVPTRTLTDAEIGTCRETGFLKVRNILTVDEIDHFEQEVRHEIESGRGKDLSPPKSGCVATCPEGGH